MKLDVAAVVLDLEGNLMRAVEYDTNGAIVPEQPVTIPEQCDHHYCRRFLQHVNEKAGGAIALATYYRLKWLVCRARAPLDIEDAQPPAVAAQI